MGTKLETALASAIGGHLATDPFPTPETIAAASIVGLKTVLADVQVRDEVIEDVAKEWFPDGAAEEDMLATRESAELVIDKLRSWLGLGD